MKQRIPFKKKTVFLSIAILSGMTISQMSFAASSAPPGKGGGGLGSASIVAAIEDLGNKVEALAVAGVKLSTKLIYQVDPSQASATQANIATISVGKQSMTPNEFVNANTNYNTQTNINNALQMIPYAVTPPAKDTPAAKAYQAYLDNNSPRKLSIGIKGSDSLYVSKLSALEDSKLTLQQRTLIAKPTAAQLHNNYFNFDALFLPTAYNSDQLTAAKRYLQYATKDYQPLTNGIDLAKLQGMKPSKLIQFLESSSYQKYLLNTRSEMAARSMALTNLYHMMAERTPVSGLGTEAGLPTKNASPLQVEKYIATHRVRNKNWYKQMASASPATVQRETVYILAETEAQNYQAHLDRERVLAALTSIEIQGIQLSQLMGKIQAANLNSSIGDASKIVQKLKKAAEKAKNNDYDGKGFNKKDREKAKKAAKKYGSGNDDS